ncbi:MAG TPA: TetR/AcrR family transcriptional regulator [Acidimicrobiales bacterium]|nr:TetR/AcrR family transcriptional regulator [Acidimicrobiales bacterium]
MAAGDGRLTRAARTRQAVVDALLTLNARGELRPTARDIAAEAGVSLRSVYVHFDDLEALFVESSRRHTELLTASLPPIVDDGPFPVRFEAFLVRRVSIHEFAPGVRRAALLQEPFSPVLQRVLTSGRQAMRAEVASSFGPELAAVDGDEMPLLRALDAASGALTWESLRVHQRLSVEQATEQVRLMLLAFVRAWVPAALDDDPTEDEAPSPPTTGPGA